VIIVPVPAELPVPSPAPPAGAPRSGRQAAAQQKLRLGDRLLAEGDTRLALFAYQDAVNQDPQSVEARLKLGRVYLHLDHPNEALEQFSVAAALDPGDAEVPRALEQARARLDGRAPPPGSPIIVRLPAGGVPEPPHELQPAAPARTP
jgi:tetratricopeptide (TPR) repeat protein